MELVDITENAVASAREYQTKLASAETEIINLKSELAKAKSASAEIVLQKVASAKPSVESIRKTVQLMADNCLLPPDLDIDKAASFFDDPNYSLQVIDSLVGKQR